VEPNLSRQWFVKVKPLAQKAIKSVEKGETKIVPDIWTKTYYDWMNNIRDWCISRQIWWGHQIPAWTCDACGEVMVAMEAPTSCSKCGKTELVQETDVLDTWFSSALWPFSTMGWPDDTRLLKTFYPTSVLVTAFDILFFWVARMMMMGIHFIGDVPFEDVYVHALVRDEDGQKMSKSKGNVIDPLTIIENYGTDAFRFTLAAFAAQGRDIKMSEKRVEGYQHFVNKLWNAARFSLMHLEQGHEGIDQVHLSLPDRWILSRLKRVTAAMANSLDNYRFNEAASELYNFVWHEFCDWYLEAVKPALYGKQGESQKQAALQVLWHSLRDILILLHPFMPFVTEEIWHKLPDTQGSIMKAAFPSDRSDAAEILPDEHVESQMTLLIELISGIRNVRGEMNIPPSLDLEVLVQSKDQTTNETIERHQDVVINLARLKALNVATAGERPKSSATAVVDGATIFVSLEGIIDVVKESERLEKEINKLSNELAGVLKKLENDAFLKKAPAQVVNKVKEKHDRLIEKQQKLRLNLDKVKELEK
jgi:valyl-tRNA synthetase